MTEVGAKVVEEAARRVHVTTSAAAAAEAAVDLLVVAAGSDWKQGELAALDSRVKGALSAEIQRQRFKGAEGDMALFQAHGGLRCRYVLLIGVGDGQAPYAWHKLTDSAMTRARDLSATSVAIALPKERLSPTLLETVAEGVHLGSYAFHRLKSAAARRPSPLERVVLLAPSTAPAFRAALRRAEVFAAATCYARDLINLPAAIATPTYLAEEARRIARKQALQVRIFDPRAIGRAGMGALLGVAQGSAQPPRFIELVYQPRVKARKCVALVGKGITFDSGGLSIKTADSMQTQKRDMAGGAAVLAVLSVIRDLALPIEVRGYVPATENMPGERAMKPGDVVRAANGKPVIIAETGWPSAGPLWGAALPSAANIAAYFSAVEGWARSANVPLFYFQAYDEPGMLNENGHGNWGIMYTTGVLKQGVAPVFLK